MTYPPPPGQPDPYGQQPPPSGGFPQQPYPQQGGWDPNQQQQPYPTQQYPQGWDPNQQQQQPAWDPNAQQHQQQYGQPYGQPQQGWDPNAGGQMAGWDQTAAYSQGFGGPPAPPKKSKTGLIIALVAVVVVLAAVGITGFVAPGFFLSKDSTTASGPDKTAQDIVDALNRKDKNALNGLKCGDAEEDIAQIIDNVDKVSDVKLNGGVTKVSETEYTAVVAMKINGNASTRKGTLGKSGDSWCWRKVGAASSSGGKTTTPKPTETTVPGSGSGSNSANPEGAAVIKSFVDKLNGNDTPGALALTCPELKESIDRWVKSLLKPPYAFTVTGIDGDYFISGDIGGTAGGKAVDGLIFATSTDGKTFCVSSFLVS